jgi:tetratricopeptide (TPR) repeat protein
MRKRKKINFKQKLVLAIAGICSAVIFAELVLRLLAGTVMLVKDMKNKQAKTKNAEYCILCIGESTTADGYPALLEKSLNAGKSGRKFKVINKGKGGVNTNIIVADIEKYLEEYKPDMVVAMMGINDNREDVFWNPSSGNNQISDFFASFRLYRLLKLISIHAGLNMENAESSNKKGPAIVKKNLSGMPDPDTKDINQALQAGRQYFQNGDYARARDILEKTIGLIIKEQELQEASFLLAASYRFCGQTKKAINMYEQSIQSGNQSDEAYRQLGNCYRHLGMFSQAEQAIKQSIKINPRNLNAHYELALCYLKQGKLDKAEDKLIYVLSEDDGHFAAYHDLIVVYSENKEYLKAIEISNEMLKKHPDEARAYGILAQLYISTGQFDKADEFFSQAQNIRSKSFPVDTFINYQKLYRILTARNIRLVCVQYPLLDVKVLEKMFMFPADVLFVDNEAVFKTALKKYNYEELFTDRFGGEFGHCTQEGNLILAENIAKTILSEFKY